MPCLARSLVLHSTHLYFTSVSPRGCDLVVFRLSVCLFTVERGPFVCLFVYSRKGEGDGGSPFRGNGLPSVPIDGDLSQVDARLLHDQHDRWSRASLLPNSSMCRSSPTCSAL